MKTRRFLAWVVAALMLLTSFALPGAREAEATSDVTMSTSQKGAEEKYYSDSGMCGSKLHWEYYSNTQALVITGSGSMYEYDENCTPWVQLGFASDIMSVSLPKGLTSIGSYSFSNCSALTSIAIPSKVKTIGENAFENCYSLGSVDLPKSVKLIDWYAFYCCYALTCVNYSGKADDRVKTVIRDGNQDLAYADWTYKKANTAALAIKTQPKDIKTNDGKYVVFKVKATGATSIQWQFLDADDPDVESNWQNAGVTSDSLTVWADYDHNGYRYRAKVSNGSTTLKSATATLTVNYVPLKIKTQPKKKITAVAGKEVSFKVKAQGASAYMWQYLEPWGDPDDNSDWSLWEWGYDTLTLTPTGYMSAWCFRCIVYDTEGNHEISNYGQLFVNVKFSKQPKSVTVLEGESVSFSVDAPGATGYTWEIKIPGYKDWYELSWYEPILSLSDCSLAYSGIAFRCWAYNETSYKVSSTAKLNVKSAPSSIKGSYRALLIGENEYSSDPLEGCVNDMSAMAGMLRGLKKTKFATKTLPNSDRAAIMTAIESTFFGATDDSVSVFYYAGHGSSSGAICPISGSNITFAQLANKLSYIPGKVIVILDSCFSGAAINKSGNGQSVDQMIKAYNQAAINAFSGYYIAEDGSTTKGKTTKSGELAKSKFIVITAASKTETSSDSYFDNSGIRQGEFTAALIQGMGCTYPNGAYSGHMPADANGDNCITLGEIYEYARDTALYWDGAQHAQYYGNLNEVLFRRK
jgi:hypothetical protein